MKFVALFTGAGDGCDYTIGCNKTFEVFNAVDHDAAIKRCKRVWEDHGGSAGEPRIEDIQLFAIIASVDVPVHQWNDEDEKDSERREAEKELREAEAKMKAAKDRLANGKKPRPSSDFSAVPSGTYTPPMTDELRDWLEKQDRLSAEKQNPKP